MQVFVNGIGREVAERCTVSQLLSDLAVEGRFAVEVNEEIVPRSLHATRPLEAGDRIEIVHAIGGG